MLRTKILSLFICISLPLAASAQEKLEPGIPYTPKVAGWFFPSDTEKQIRYRLMEADYFEKRLGLQDTLIKELTEQSNLNKQLADNYQKAYQSAERANGRSKILFFTLGALSIIAGGIALGYASHALK